MDQDVKPEYTILDAIIFPRNDFLAKISEAWSIWGIFLNRQTREGVVICSTGF